MKWYIGLIIFSGILIGSFPVIENYVADDNLKLNCESHSSWLNSKRTLTLTRETYFNGLKTIDCNEYFGIQPYDGKIE